MKTLERRLQALETRYGGDDGSYEVWIGGDDDGDLLGPNGETMTAWEVAACSPRVLDISGTTEGGSHEEP